MTMSQLLQSQQVVALGVRQRGTRAIWTQPTHFAFLDLSDILINTRSRGESGGARHQSRFSPRVPPPVSQVDCSLPTTRSAL